MFSAICFVLPMVAGCPCGATNGIAAAPETTSGPRVEIHWVERFWVRGLTVDRTPQSSDDSENEYYPHIEPVMTLCREDVAEASLQQFDWVMNDTVVHHYSVTLVLTDDARRRLAENCPDNMARITVSVDGRYWGWDYFTADNDADVSERWKAKNYSPCLGLMSQADAESIVNAFK